MAIIIKCTPVLADPVPLEGDITVTSLTDFDDTLDPPNGICTLREAFNNEDNRGRPNIDCESGGSLKTRIRFGKDRNGVTVKSVSINPSFGPFSVNANAIVIGPVTIVGTRGKTKTQLLHVTGGGNLTLNDVSLERGSSVGSSGGTGLIEGILTMNSGTVQENEADRGGGFDVEGNASFEGVDFLGNKAVNGIGAIGGGAIRASSSSVVSVEDCSFNFNASDGPGAAIWTELGTPSVTIERSSFIGNLSKTPLGDGGAAFLTGTATISDSVFVGNTAQGDRGGGAIFFAKGMKAIVENVEIKDNRIGTLNPSASGGGINSEGGGTIAISGANIVGNKAWVGGGVRSGPNGILIVNNSTIAKNLADIAGYAARDDSGAGGGLYAEGPVGLFGTTVKDNSGLAQITARGADSQVEFGNSVVWTLNGIFNCDGDGKFIQDTPSLQSLDWVGGSCPLPRITQKASDVFEGEDTFTAPVGPSAVPLEHTIWIPTATSPLVHAGDPTLCTDPATLRNVDERGLSRSSCDVGAVEAK